MHETLRTGLTERRPLLGGWVSGGADYTFDLYRRAGYDWVGLDCQHAAVDETYIAGVLKRTPPSRTATFVRVSKNDSALIGKVADAGADGVIVPAVDTAESAAIAVGAVNYPPDGMRSLGPMRPDMDVRDLGALAERVAVFVMIETVQGLSNVEAICAVPGLTGVYVGPGDLSVGLGLDPLAGLSTDQLVGPMQRIRAACDSNGLVLGMHQLTAAGARAWIARGVQLITLGGDTSTFVQAVSSALADVRSGGTGDLGHADEQSKGEDRASSSRP